MTSLDFQALLKQEKALRRAQRADQVAGQGSNPKNAAQPPADPPRNHGVSSIAEVGGDERDGDSRLPSGVATQDGVGHSALPACFAELAARPPLEMEKMRVGSTPTIFYAPNFVSEADAKHILARTYAATADAAAGSKEGDASAAGWVALRSRRLKCWGGQPGEGFRQEPLPPWVDSLCDALVRRGVFAPEDRPNHVLLNEYQPGQGIMPHTDGPFYAPRTATLSLGSDAMMHFSPRIAAADIGKPGVDSGPQSSLLLRERCLVVFADEAYSRLLHGIDAVRDEQVGARGAPVINADAAGAPEGAAIRRKLRVSLTFRRVRAGRSCER